MRNTLTECAMALAIVAMIAPGVIWSVGTIIALFTGERPW